MINATIYTEGATQWCRVVMNREIDRFIAAQPHQNWDVVEISGSRFKHRFPFRSYRETQYPEYDVCAGPLATEICDLVVAEQVLEHVERPDKAVVSVFETLRPGGLFIVNTPFLVKVHNVPVDLYRWTEKGMRVMLETAGFTSLEVRSWGNLKCLKADLLPHSGWEQYNRFFHSLENEPVLPIVIWAIAQKPYSPLR
jgi:SAM-dependent methyltransferase